MVGDVDRQPWSRGQQQADLAAQPRNQAGGGSKLESRLVSYAVTKRRAGRAPEGSGVPVGTEYHWYVLAHQNTTKQSANDYTTSLTGLKFKIAHKHAGSDKGSATPKTQRKRMIAFLQSVIADLEKQIDSAGDVISSQEQPAAPAPERKVRRPRSIMKRAT